MVFQLYMDLFLCSLVLFIRLPTMCPAFWSDQLVIQPSYRADAEVESRIGSWEPKQIPSSFVLHARCHILNCYWCLYFSIWHFGFFEVGTSVGQSCEWWKWTRPTPRSWPLLQSLPHPAAVKASLFCSISWVCDYRPTLRALRVRLLESGWCVFSPI